VPPSRSLTVRAADGTALHTEVFGPPDGYPIVLTHGIVCAIRAWAYQIAHLATDYRVIAFDHRGHGRSDVPRRGGYSLEHLASDLDSVLEATLAPHERAVLAGHSMGGIAIAAWSEHYRDKVRRRADAVALINTTTGDLLRKVKLLSVPRELSPARVMAGRSLINVFGGIPIPGVARIPSRYLVAMLAVAAEADPSAGVAQGCSSIQWGAGT
jgi:pimeloyl-ACP methyl ester carboxylesterase